MPTTARPVARPTVQGAGSVRGRRSTGHGPSLLLLVFFFAFFAAPTAHGQEKLWRELPPGSATGPAAADGCPDLVSLVQRVAPSVVSLSIVYQEEEADDPEVQTWLRWHRKRDSDLQLGSGFILRQDGYILTNQHLIGEATQITVRLADERELTALVVGQDARTDLALLKVQAHDLPTVPLGDSDRLMVGQTVFAIGNPLGLSSTVTAGIVSALEREQPNGDAESVYIQTDASINPGNSGGPLVNLRGEVVGINTAMVHRSDSASAQPFGIGFAIPINQAKRLLPQLLAHGRVQRGWLGIRTAPWSRALANSLGLERPRGALVQEVIRDSPADQAGLQPGDVVLSLDGRPLARPANLSQLVSSLGPGRKIRLGILRDGQEQSTSLTLASAPGAGNEPREQRPAPATELPAAAIELGLRVVDVPPEISAQLGLAPGVGVLVVAVEQGSLAAGAGLRAEDVVLRAGRSEIRDLASFRQVLRGLTPGSVLNLRVQRGVRRLFFSLSLE